MQLSENIRVVCDDIARKFSPQEIILFSCKRTVTGEIASFKICVVMETPDRREAERQIYLQVDSECPYDALVYTPAEWKKHTVELHSFAHSINEKGTVVYGQAS